MAKTKTPVKNISDKLAKVNENFTINMYDNGYMIEVNGRDANDDWSQVKITCNTLDEVNTLIKEANDLDKV